MPKNAKAKPLQLSRYFQENLKAVKKTALTVDFEASPYFHNLSQHELKKKKVKRKHFGPQFKGFSLEDLDFSVNKEIRMDEIVIESENRLKDAQGFLGFTPEEIGSSNVLRDKTRELTRPFRNKKESFLGFPKEECTDASRNASQVLQLYTSARTSIYKHIDRRVLTNHMKNRKGQEKIGLGRSKYWWQDSSLPLKTEDKTWNRNLDFSFLKIPDQYEKVPENQFDRESIILSQIRTLHEELHEIRKMKYATSEEAKLQNSPFIQIKRELIMAPFIPPKSPHHLIEEELYHDPWALLVATIFLNKTSGRAARPYVLWFLEENPDPLVVVEKKAEDLQKYFGALGLQKTRATKIWRMSHDFLYKEWKRVGELYGIGRYGEDAFRMFCLGDFSVEPKDRYLKIYKAWYEMEEKNMRFIEMNS